MLVLMWLKAKSWLLWEAVVQVKVPYYVICWGLISLHPVALNYWVKTSPNNNCGVYCYLFAIPKAGLKFVISCYQNHNSNINHWNIKLRPYHSRNFNLINLCIQILFHFGVVVCAIFCHLSSIFPFICMFILVVLLPNRVKACEKPAKKNV